jgi:Protein of unknown function (DUF3800)
MLQGFFDESFHHVQGRDQRLLQLTIGGCIASIETWNEFQSDWQAFLDHHAVVSFHRNLYANRNIHQAILDDASQIIISRGISCYGFTVFIPDEHRPKKPKTLLQTMYDVSAVDAVWNSAQHARAVGDQIDVIFARHGDFSLFKLKQLFADFQSTDPLLHSVAHAEPQRSIPLQAADFVAYEIQLYHRAEISREEQSRPLHPIIQHAEWQRWTNGAPAFGRRLYLERPLPP